MLVIILIERGHVTLSVIFTFHYWYVQLLLLRRSTMYLFRDIDSIHRWPIYLHSLWILVLLLIVCICVKIRLHLIVLLLIFLILNENLLFYTLFSLYSHRNPICRLSIFACLNLILHFRTSASWLDHDSLFNLLILRFFT